MEYDHWDLTPEKLKGSGYSLVRFRSGLTDPYDVYLKEVYKVKNIGSVKHCFPKGADILEPQPGAFQSFFIQVYRAETKNEGLSITVPFISAGLKHRLVESSDMRFGYSNAEEYAVDYIALQRFFDNNIPDYVPDDVSDAEEGDMLMITGILRVRNFEMSVSTKTETGYEIKLGLDYINDNINAEAGFEATSEKVDGATYKVSFSSEDEFIPLAVATRLLTFNEHTKRFMIGREPYRP